MNKRLEYKGLYNLDKDQSVIYYEYGAHFSYKALYKALELILNSNNKNIKFPHKNFFPNLKKTNSQKIINNGKNSNFQKMNISRNAKSNRINIYDKLINNDKLYKSKSINQKLELSRSYNDDIFGSFSTKNKVNNKNYKNKNYKEIKKRQIQFKKNSTKKNKQKKQNILLLNNKNILRNRHTVLKNVIIPKKLIEDKNVSENYYGFSINNNNDSDIYSYGNDTSLNSTGNYSNYDNLNHSKNNSFNKNTYTNKYKKIKISSIINKKYFKKLISNSPKNSSSFIRNNTSDYYSKNKTQRISDKNILNYTNKIKYNNSGVEFDNIINDNNNNYYIENDNCNYFQGFVNNKNILLNNNIKQKNKKLSIFNNFNKINFHQNEKTNYLNSFKNPLILGKKIKKLNSGKNSIIKINPKYKTNIIYNTTKENSNSFLNTNKISSKKINIYNHTTNSKNKSTKKRLLKNHNSYNNILDINQKNKNNKNSCNKNLESITFFIRDEKSSSRNKKSRNNNSKNIVNLLCCHFSINFNSPINLLNNIQNNFINNDNTINNVNNRTPKVTSSNVFDINNNFQEIKNTENINLNNISKSRNIKANVIPVNKSIENDINKNMNKKIICIPINKEKNNKAKLKPLTKKSNNILVKKKTKQNFTKGRLNLSKKKKEQSLTNNKNINKLIYKKLSRGNIKNSNSNSNNYSMNNISTNSNINNKY